MKAPKSIRRRHYFRAGLENARRRRGGKAPKCRWLWL